MTIAIVGVGALGGVLARLLVAGGETVVLAAKSTEHARALADELGPLARAASAPDAIGGADTVIVAVTFESARELVSHNAELFAGKVVIDPTNPLEFDQDGNMIRLLPEGQSAGQILADLLPKGAHYAKALSILPAPILADGANREPKRAALFYATDYDLAGKEAERLIQAVGYDPVQVGGVAAAGRIEAPGGDLGYHGELFDADQARTALN
jgi:predicted dinucleotide-binding enzyme